MISRLFIIIVIITIVTGCSSKSNGKTFELPPTVTHTSIWEKGVYPSSFDFYQKCENPRTGINPLTNQPYPDTEGTSMDEKMWLRSLTNELYLWYDEVEDVNPNLYFLEDYYELLKKDGDRFHYSEDAESFYSYYESGVSVGYGIHWKFNSYFPRASIDLTDIETTSEYFETLNRGDTITMIDGIDLTNDLTQSEYYTIIDALFPSEANATHEFTFTDIETSNSKTVSLQAGEIIYDPVPRHKSITTETGTVGYLQFNDHNKVAEVELIDAITELKEAGIDDLVLDLRYNSGGYLSVASELAFMIAGTENTNNKTFEFLKFNDKYPGINPITGEETEPLLFLSEATGLSVDAGQALPSLNLSRVFVLTSGDTCSASESIINGLSGIDIEVIQIGTSTCGKPYGFYSIENCGIVYSTVMFKGVNDKDFGDFEQGFTPTNTPSEENQTTLAGCAVADDVTHPLGDIEEALLANALSYQATGECLSDNPEIIAAQKFNPSIYSRSKPAFYNINTGLSKSKAEKYYIK